MLSQKINLGDTAVSPFLVWLIGRTAYPTSTFKTISGVIAATFYPQSTLYNICNLHK